MHFWFFTRFACWLSHFPFFFFRSIIIYHRIHGNTNRMANMTILTGLIHLLGLSRNCTIWHKILHLNSYLARNLITFNIHFMTVLTEIKSIQYEWKHSLIFTFLNCVNIYSACNERSQTSVTITWNWTVIKSIVLMLIYKCNFALKNIENALL